MHQFCELIEFDPVKPQYLISEMYIFELFWSKLILILIAMVLVTVIKESRWILCHLDIPKLKVFYID